MTQSDLNACSEIARLNREIDRLRSILPAGLATFPDRIFDDLPKDVGSLTIYHGGRTTFDHPILLRGLYCHNPNLEGDVAMYHGVHEGEIPAKPGIGEMLLDKGTSREIVNAKYYLYPLRKIGEWGFIGCQFSEGFTLEAQGDNAQITLFYSML